MKKTFGIVAVAITFFAFSLTPQAAGAERGQKVQHQEGGPITCPAGTAITSMDAFLKSLDSCTVPRKHRWMVWKPRREPAVKTKKTNKGPMVSSAFFSIHQPRLVVQ
jgi:hypothetical protein